MKTRSTMGIVLAGVLACLVTACGGGDPLARSTNAAENSAASVTIGSANFPESELLARLYEGALKAKGIPVTTKLDIASRETYVPALEKGEISLIPEYTGNFATYFDKSADVSDEASAYRSLQKALPDNLVALEAARAQDSDALVVTRDTASRWKLTSIADLAPHQSEVTLGGPPEWRTRPDGVAGLERVYGLTFREFRPLDSAGTLTVQALRNGQVQAANLFTTDPNIVANDFVVLQDPKHLFGAQNVVPVMTKEKATPEVQAALNAVSAKLDTATLAGLLKQVVIDKSDSEDVATQWLSANGLA